MDLRKTAAKFLSIRRGKNECGGRGQRYERLSINGLAVVTQRSLLRSHMPPLFWFDFSFQTAVKSSPVNFQSATTQI